MGKKLKMIPFLFRSLTVDSSQSWPWPSCSSQPKTLSFRAAPAVDVIKTVNSLAAETENSGDDEEEEEEAVLSGLRATGRLFFEPGETSSILNPPAPAPAAVVVEQGTDDDDALLKGSHVTAIDSLEPLMDFRKSMEEMVEAHGLTDWAGFEELLAVYLHVNERCNHGYIVAAFADLLINKICFSPSTTMTSSMDRLPEEGDDDRHMGSSMSRSPTSAFSFSSSSSSSIVQSSLPLLEPDDDDDEIQITTSTTSVI